MQGLLDFVKTPEGQGLLSGIFGYAANARRGQPINSLGRGGIAGLMGYANAQDRQDQQAETQWMKQYRQVQMDKAQYEMDRTRAQDAEQARVNQLLQGAFSPVSGSQAIGVDGRGPTADKVPLIGQMPKIDYQALLAQGVPVEKVKALAEAQNFGRSKVARTQEVMGPNGEKMIVQLDDFGNSVGNQMAGYVAPVQVNQGDKITFTTPQAGASFKVGMSPSERDASARGWASNRIAQDRLDMDRGQGAYSFNADLGGYVPKAPGGKFVPLDSPPKSAKLTESEAKNSLYLSQMREATAALEGLKTSPVSVAMTNTPYTNWMAGDDSQKAGQAQRQWAEAYLRAKTGAAATAGEVENNVRTFFPVVGDSDATIRRKSEARKAAESGMELPAGRGADKLPQAPNNNSPKAPMRGQVVDGFKFKGGNPADPSSWEQVR